MITLGRVISQRLKTSKKAQHNFNEVGKVVFARPIGRCEESLRLQLSRNRVQTQQNQSINQRSRT